jgi:molybdopterin synthase sulfur carrier subunit
MATVNVLYFASLRDATGIDSETIEHDGDLRSLYTALQGKHAFSLPVERLRVAMNGAFSRWDDVPGEGAEIAFIPPVSGG